MIGGDEYARMARKEISGTLSEGSEKVKLRSLLAKDIRPVLWVGIVLAAFQQWCGINVVFDYAEEVFSAAGYGISDILLNIVITGAVNLVALWIQRYVLGRPPRL